MHRISRTASFTAGLLIGASVLAATSSATASGGDGQARAATSSAPRSKAAVLSDPPLFGLVRGGAPWVISEGTARLRANGDLRAEVEGLVIPTTGVNPVPRLSATVVCNGIALPPDGERALQHDGRRHHRHACHAAREVPRPRGAAEPEQQHDDLHRGHRPLSARTGRMPSGGS